MGGDIAHHGGEFRPTTYLPLPPQISPSPTPEYHLCCPSEVYLRLHPKESNSEPYLRITTSADGKSIAYNLKDAEESIEKLAKFDACDDVFVMIAHDKTLIGVVETFPQIANEWQKKGWKQKGYWRFLRSFETNQGSEN
jgi:hypothetical protein